MNSAPHQFDTEAMSPSQRWDAICKLIGVAQLEEVHCAEAQTEAAECIASTAHEAACDQLIELLLPPEAGRMLTDVTKFLDFTYGGRP